MVRDFISSRVSSFGSQMTCELCGKMLLRILRVDQVITRKTIGGLDQGETNKIYQTNFARETLGQRKEIGSTNCRSRPFAARREEVCSDVDVCTFWCKKYRIIQNLWRVHTDKGVQAERTFCEGGGGSIFAILCGRPLRTAS